MNPWQLRVFMCVCVRVLSLVWLLHSSRLLTCKTGSIAWRQRSPAPSLFQRPRQIAVCVLYSRALSLFQPRQMIFVCWCSLNAHALCSVLSGGGRQPAPCLWLGLQQDRWLGLEQARSGASSVWCCCSCVHSARDTTVARKWLALGLRARST